MLDQTAPLPSQSLAAMAESGDYEQNWRHLNFAEEKHASR